MTAALVAAGVGLAPWTAQAAGSAAPAANPVATPDTVPDTTPDTTPDRAGGPKSETFTSPADRTVVTSSSPSGTPQTRATANPVPEIMLHVIPISARKIILDVRTWAVSDDHEVVIDWADGATDTSNPGMTRVVTKEHVYTEVGTYAVKVTVTDRKNNVTATNVVNVATDGTEFTAHEPTRLLDTRAGVGAAKAKVAGRSSVALKVAGAAKVPAGVRAVVLNVTVTNTRAPGHISVQSDKGLAETVQTSNVNYLAGQSVPNLVIAKVGKDGTVHLFNGGWDSVDLIADVTGYFTSSAADGYTALTSARAVDTREGLGTSKGQVPGYGTFDVALAGQGRVSKRATAVALNLTVTNPRDHGHLTAYPSGQQAPATSSVNFAPGQTVANAVVVPVGPDGKITIRNGSWMPTDVVIDVVGYYSAESPAAYVPSPVPYRTKDTRKDQWLGLEGVRSGPVPARSYMANWLPRMLQQDPEETAYDPPPSVGWALNVTVTNTTGVGFLSVAPDHNEWVDYQYGGATAPARPVPSSLNWTAGATVPNLVQTATGDSQMADFWNQGWSSADIIVDVQGWYQLE